ncbi:MAG: ATP-binding protein [Ruminiclostridium sp.]|nr:ATP-binding protein [Ruminiclostridium sp.]
MEVITVPAEAAMLERVDALIQEKLETIHCPIRTQMQVKLAVEEIFINIASYAYPSEVGQVEVGVDIDGDPPVVTIRFVDQGCPFDPLEKPDPDVTLGLQEREPGGLGILLVKKFMDQVGYVYENGRNILTIKKEIK